MSKQTSSEGIWIAVIDPEGLVYLMNAIVIDEGADLVEPVMEIRHGR